MGKVYCRYCGKLIDEDATFCTHCGKEQNISKEPSWDADGLRCAGESFINKSLALIRSSYEKMRKVKFPQISAERADLWRKWIERLKKVVLAFLIIVIVVSIGAWGYDYYNQYLNEKRLAEEEKRLDKACADIINKMHSNDKLESIDYCRKVLMTQWAFRDNGESWGYENVPDLQITERISSYHNEAFRTIESEAYNGNPIAQYLIGHIYIGPKVSRYDILVRNNTYERVYSVAPDTVKAVYWWNEAAKQGYTLAYNCMGIAYKFGYGVDKDMNKAIEFLKKGAEAGDADAQCNYGCIFQNGYKEKTGTHKETRSTADYFSDHDRVIRKEFDAERGEHITYYWVEVDDSVIVIPKDIEQAKYWWKKAAEQGNEYAKDMLQKVYE